MKTLPRPVLAVLVLLASLLAATVAASWPQHVTAAPASTASR
jgi:hypothetical protein